jgi:two-component sensor histidine kinase
VPTLTDLARNLTSLSGPELEWLHSLVSDWQLLADLSFADLILWVPRRASGELRAPERALRAPEGELGAPAGPLNTGWVAVAQMRPTTGPTSFPDDVVGTQIAPAARPVLDTARAERRIHRESDPDWTSGVPVRAEAIPVTRDGQVIAVIERSTNLSGARTPSRLELTYLAGADDLARMVSEGTFPHPGHDTTLVRSPRVGDGLLRLDAAGRVTFASPNAQSAYRRLGLAADLMGTELGTATAQLAANGAPVDESLMLVTRGRAPRETEIDVNGTAVQLRSIPLVVGGQRTGALVLVRDVTELRRRERELLTKEATIREIHHRVKNNLQTVAALLRLQARRLSAPEARAALQEAVRRVGSIAIVHETLSHAPEEIVDFDDIADRVAMMAGEVSSPEVRVTPKITGQFGMLPATVATPLAMVLTELLQNALQHGFGSSSPSSWGSSDGDAGIIEVVAARAPELLTVTVTDSGAGLPPDFDLENTTSLGLQIVRTLVEGELSGKITLRTRPGGGTVAIVDLPVRYEPALSPAERWAGGPAGRRRRPPGYPRGLGARTSRYTPARARSRSVRRLSARRSSSLMPPQTPASWPESMAQRRHSSSTVHRWQTCLASSICRSAGPLFPIGKNSSGSTSRQAAMWRQSMVSPSRRNGWSSVRPPHATPCL